MELDNSVQIETYHFADTVFDVPWHSRAVTRLIDMGVGERVWDKLYEMGLEHKYIGLDYLKRL